MKKERKSIVLIGAGDTGAAVAEMLLENKQYQIEGFLDDAKKGKVQGIPIIGATAELNYVKRQGIDNIAICISLDINARERIKKHAESIGLFFPNLIHQSSVISPKAKLCKGIIAFEFTSINYKAKIGDFTILKPFVNVSYNAHVDSFCLLGPYVLIGSYAKVSQKNILLARSTISSSCEIGKGCTIYPHSFVTKSIPPLCNAYGVPAEYVPKGKNQGVLKAKTYRP